ncbi:MAG TPA: HEAT repeat domain-containing protein [Thermoanaerobaculia bacterium]
MDIQEYRRQVEEELEREAASASLESVGSDADPVSTAADPSASGERRIRAIRELAGSARENRAEIEILLRLLRSDSEPPAVRLAALGALGQLQFTSPLFNEMRPEFIDTLRSAVDASDEEVRTRVLETLAQHKDEYAQRRLLAGLRGEEPPLVPEQKAIQFLGYDIHAEHYPLLREIVERSDSPGVRREAVRLLSSDPTAVEILGRVFQDRTEHHEVRRAAAGALATLAPQDLEGRAKEVALDPGEAPALRATSLTALEHFGNPAALEADQEFLERLDAGAARTAITEESMDLGSGPAATELDQAISRFKGRFGRK